VVGMWVGIPVGRAVVGSGVGCSVGGVDVGNVVGGAQLLPKLSSAQQRTAATSNSIGDSRHSSPKASPFDDPGDTTTPSTPHRSCVQQGSLLRSHPVPRATSASSSADEQSRAPAVVHTAIASVMVTASWQSGTLLLPQISLKPRVL
jgi:hypothetical protein